MVNNLDCFQGNVGHSLLEARVRVQLNLQKAAEAVLISPEQLQAIEEGSLTPSVDTVVALAKVYQAPVENFLAPLYINFYKSTQEYQAQKQAQQEILKPKLDNNEDLTVKEQDLQALPEITMRKEYFCEDFPEKLKRIRQNAGLSVKDLAHALQLSSTLILSWEEGRLLPTTFKQVVQITQELKATLLDFIKAEAFPNAVVNPKKSYNVLYIKARKEHSKFLRTLPQVSLNQKLWLWSIPEDIFSNIPVNIALEIKVYACFGDFIKKGGSIALPPEIIYQMIGTDAKLASSLQTEIEAYRAQILAERSSSKALSVKAQTKAQSLEVSKQCLTSQEQNLALNPTKPRYSASRVITEYLLKLFHFVTVLLCDLVIKKEL